MNFIYVNDLFIARWFNTILLNVFILYVHCNVILWMLPCWKCYIGNTCICYTRKNVPNPTLVSFVIHTNQSFHAIVLSFLPFFSISGNCVKNILSTNSKQSFSWSLYIDIYKANSFFMCILIWFRHILTTAIIIN